jgi:hypothetical protein
MQFRTGLALLTLRVNGEFPRARLTGFLQLEKCRTYGARCFDFISPALPPWANLCRDYGAGERHQRTGLSKNEILASAQARKRRLRRRQRQKRALTVLRATVNSEAKAPAWKGGRYEGNSDGQGKEGSSERQGRKPGAESGVLRGYATTTRSRPCSLARYRAASAARSRPSTVVPLSGKLATPTDMVT